MRVFPFLCRVDPSCLKYETLKPKRCSLIKNTSKQKIQKLASQITFQRTVTTCGWPQPMKLGDDSGQPPPPAFLLGGASPPQVCVMVSLFTWLSCPFMTQASSFRGETERRQPCWKRSWESHLQNAFTKQTHKQKNISKSTELFRFIYTYPLI